MKVRTQGIPQNVCFDEDEMQATVAGELGVTTRSIIIAERDTAWVYALFPALLYWRTRGVPITVFVPLTGDDGRHGPYRRRLLRALGVQLQEVEQVPFEGYLFDPTESDSARAVLRIPHMTSVENYEAIRYVSPYDLPAISALLKELDALRTEGHTNLQLLPQILSGKQEELLRAIRTVRQYDRDGVSVTLENIRTSSIVSLTPYAREKKYRQTPYLVRLYREKRIELFAPAYVDFGDGKISIVTPPVVEESGGRFVLIEGTNRAAYCRDKEIDTINCVVVRGVRDPLPARQRVDLRSLIVIGRTLKPVDRYEGFSHVDYRPVEKATHPLDGLR
jgi:hypothetical protein